MVNKDGDMGQCHDTDYLSWEMMESLPSIMGTPGPRSREDAHPSRISKMWNVTTPMGVWSRGRGCTLQASKPTATAANPSAGQDGPRSECGHAERQRECITGPIGRYPIRKDADGGETSQLRTIAMVESVRGKIGASRYPESNGRRSYPLNPARFGDMSRNRTRTASARM
jgi:hypothetical protein